MKYADVNEFHEYVKKFKEIQELNVWVNSIQNTQSNSNKKNGNKRKENQKKLIDKKKWNVREIEIIFMLQNKKFIGKNKKILLQFWFFEFILK